MMDEYDFDSVVINRHKLRTKLINSFFWGVVTGLSITGIANYFY